MWATGFSWGVCCRRKMRVFWTFLNEHNAATYFGLLFSVTSPPNARSHIIYVQSQKVEHHIFFALPHHNLSFVLHTQEQLIVSSMHWMSLDWNISPRICFTRLCIAGSESTCKGRGAIVSTSPTGSSPST